MNVTIKTIITAVILIKTQSIYADFTTYDLTLYTPESWIGGADEYVDTNFWSHNYWNFTTDRNECLYRGCQYNTATHSGVDFAVTDMNNDIYSYGFGKIIHKRTAYGQVSIRHLVNTGQYFQVNLLHSSGVDPNIIDNNYIAKNQFIGIKDGIGADGTDVYADHLHFEVAESVTLTAPLTDNAHPGPGALRPSDPDFIKGGLIAHYTSNDTNVRYYNPNIFSDTKRESIPILSRTNNPDAEANYDVYGVADETIYSYLNLSGTFSSSSTVVRHFSTGLTLRNRYEERGTLGDEDRFLGGRNDIEPTTVDGIHGESEYGPGDYLFVAWLIDDNETRYGYPVKYSFVKKGNIIIDNDQMNADTDFNNDTESDPAYNGSVGSKVPGYFLTADLHTGRSNAWAQWKPYQKGRYEIYVHIPEYGATATSVRYVIKEDGETPILSKPINQNSHAGEWVRVQTDNKNSFQFSDTGYIGLSLVSDVSASNFNITEDQNVAFDAVKFIKPFNIAPILSLLLNNTVSTTVGYFENFEQDPNYTSLSTPHAYWDAAEGNYIVKTYDNLNAKYWAYSPQFGSMDAAKPISISIDILFENQEFGTYPAVSFYASAPIEKATDENPRIFSIISTYRNSYVRRLGISDHSPNTPLYLTPQNSIVDNTWYNVKIVTDGTGHANITIIDNVTGDLIYDETNVEFVITDFSYIGVGYYDEPNYGHQWSPIRIDNISVQYSP